MQTTEVHKTVTEARQANRRLDNFWVLLLSLGAIIVIFAVIFSIYFAMTPSSTISP